MNKRFNTAWLMIRTVVYYKQQFLLTLLSVALCSMVITGALIIGDSVEKSLYLISAAARGRAEKMVYSSDRWFSSNSADELNRISDTTFSAMIKTDAYLATDLNQNSLNVSLYGADTNFFKLALNPKTRLEPPQPGEIYLNEQAALHLQAEPGDTLAMRFFKTGNMPVDAPFSSSGTGLQTTQVKVAKIVDADHGGNFDFRTSQQTPFNAFVNVEHLGSLLGKSQKRNMVISDAQTSILGQMKDIFDLNDYSLELQQNNDLVELRSKGVFIDEGTARAVDSLNYDYYRVFGYFVNSIVRGDKIVPYSFVSGSESEPSGTEDDQIRINSWLAERLDASPGDRIDIAAYRIDLVEATASFKLEKILPMTDSALDQGLAPMFPGMKRAESCYDWDPDFPVNLERISDEDEEYWYEYRNLPKAFITYNRAVSEWKNRFGAITLVRFTNVDKTELRTSLLKALDPAVMGFIEVDLRESKEHGIKNAIDFSGLFMGLGFFIIVAALILTGMLFMFNLEKRENEFAILQVCGFSRSQLMKVLSFESFAIALIGSALGVIPAVLYAHITVEMLKTLWQGAINSPILITDIRVQTLVTGTAISTLVCFLALVHSLKKFHNRNKSSALKGEKQKPEPGWTVPIIAIVFVIVLLIFPAEEVSQTVFFFTAGVLALIATTQISIKILMRAGYSSRPLSNCQLAVKNTARKADRSKAIIRVVACAIFLLIAVSSNRKGVTESPEDKRSGTGGFTHYIETALPLTKNLNTKSARYELKIEDLSPKINMVQMPIRAGTDASCFNLKRVESPSITAVNPEEFSGRFSFASLTGASETDWTLLNKDYDDDLTVAAITDLDTILWNFGMTPGDKLEIETSDGRTARLKLVAGLSNSILQGKLIVSADNFYRLWPDSYGSKIILVDSPADILASTTEILSRGLQRYGSHLELSHHRLASFNQVQNTYLAIFAMLGGIGLILGCGGLIILINRNLLDRRRELSFMRICGFSPAELRRMIFVEHGILFALAMGCGLVSAAIAVIPVATSATGDIPVKEILSLIIIIAICSSVSIFWASSFKAVSAKELSRES